MRYIPEGTNSIYIVAVHTCECWVCALPFFVHLRANNITPPFVHPDASNFPRTHEVNVLHVGIQNHINGINHVIKKNPKAKGSTWDGAVMTNSLSSDIVRFSTLADAFRSGAADWSTVSVETNLRCLTISWIHQYTNDYIYNHHATYL